MDPLLTAIVVGLAALGLVPPLSIAVLNRRRRREQLAFWRQAAGQVGLSGVEVSAGGLTGSTGSLQARLSSYGGLASLLIPGGAAEFRGTRLDITSSRLAPGLTLRPESPDTPTPTSTVSTSSPWSCARPSTWRHASSRQRTWRAGSPTTWLASRKRASG